MKAREVILEAREVVWRLGMWEAREVILEARECFCSDAQEAFGGAGLEGEGFRVFGFS